MMSRKNYRAIADAFSDQLDKLVHTQSIAEREAVRDALYSLAIDVANHMQADNPRFDRPQFFMACGF